MIDFFTTHAPVLTIVVFIFGALLAPVFGRINNSLSYYCALITTALSFVLSVYLLFSVYNNAPLEYFLGGWKPPYGIEYRVDILNSFILSVVSFVSFLSVIYGYGSIKSEIYEKRHPAFYSVYLLFIGGMMGILITNDIFNMYVFLEITSLAGYALIAMGRTRYSYMASFNYLILGSVGATFFLIGIGYLYMQTGTLNLTDLAQRLQGHFDTNVVLVAIAFIVVGLMLKMAVFPLHFWLPDAYTYSPSVISAAMAGTSTKVAAYLLIRLMYTIFGIQAGFSGINFSGIIIVIASITILAGSIIAISQTDLKKMLAFSSIGQIGYILIGTAMVNKYAFAGGLLHILNHAMMKTALFMVAGGFFYKFTSTKINDLKGMGRQMPFASAMFLILSLSMVGIPLTVGFISKWYIILGAAQSGYWIVVPVILLSSLLTAIYFGRVVHNLFFKDSEASNTGILHAKIPYSMVSSTAVLVFLCIFFGVFAYMPVEISLKAAENIIGAMPWK